MNSRLRLVTTPTLSPGHQAGTNKQGINVSDITKLKAAGIVTVLGVAQTPRKNLAKIKVGLTPLCLLTAQGLSEVRLTCSRVLISPGQD